MAIKKVFFASKTSAFKEEEINYTFYPGFAVSQKQKNIESLHESIVSAHPVAKPLEISTKSEVELGVRLSAFNLMYTHKEVGPRHIENVFQSSKTFINGGPFRDLLNVAPKDAKRDSRLNTSGALKCFDLYGERWPLEPQTAFYDWIYINALLEHKSLAEEVLEYNCFTDIEFNHNKSINCQARAAAIFVSLSKQGVLMDKMQSRDAFISIYEEQCSLF